MRRIPGSVTRLLALLAAIACSSPAMAFESEEHERMSNLAYALALDYFAKHYQGDDKRQKLEIAEKLRGTPGRYHELDSLWPWHKRWWSRDGEAISYGDLVTCVDFFLYPEKILAEVWRRSGERVGSDRPPGHPGGFPVTDGPEFLSLGPCIGFSLAAAQAAHNNHAHFQQDLLISQRVYHLAAMHAARSERNLYGALVLNALSDHYLQDFFAPGHIVTPRGAMADVPATARHDRANDDGLYFTLLPETADDLLPLLAQLCAWEVKKPAEVRELISKRAACNVGGDQKQLIGRSTEDLAAAIGDLFGSRPVPFKMLGDFRLWSSSQLRQRLALLLIQTRSILDVLEAGTNHFLDSRWKAEVPHAPTIARIAYGEYRLEHNEYYAARSRIADKRERPGDRDIDRTGFKPGDAYRTQVANGMFGVSVHRESFSSGVQTSRRVTTVETVIAGRLVYANGRIPSLNIGVITGWAWFNEGTLNGNGPTVRLVATIPDTEISHGPYWRWLSYPTDGRDSRRWSGGYRFDMGFSTYLTAFLGVGRDWGTAIEPGGIEGSLHRGTVWTAGLQVAWPSGRVIPPRKSALP